MECMEFQYNLDDFIDATLSEPELKALEIHMSTCGECRDLFHTEQGFRKAMKNLPSPNLDGIDFEAMVRKAKDANQRRERRQRMIGAAWALAACLILAVLIGVKGNRLPLSPIAMQPIMASHEVQNRVVNLVVNCPVDMKDAQLTITLPAEVEIAGFPGQQEISWHTDLMTGGNLLPLEIISRADGPITLTTRIQHHNKSRTTTVQTRI